MSALNGHSPDDSSRYVGLVTQALRQAVADSTEQRLFKSGKFPGLFPNRAGVNGDAAAWALRTGLIEVCRSETKGKTAIEWVRPTPRGVAWLHDHDSPQAVLADLHTALRSTQASLPAWLDDMRQQLRDLSDRLTGETARMLDRLERLEARLGTALQNHPIGQGLSARLEEIVPWGAAVLTHLDRRGPEAAACPLPELFEAVYAQDARLTLTDFQDGLRRLRDAGILRLLPVTGEQPLPRPEYALPDGAELLYLATRERTADVSHA